MLKVIHETIDLEPLFLGELGIKPITLALLVVACPIIGVFFIY